MKTKKNGSKTPARRHVVVTNASYGIYYGEVEASDAEISAAKAVRVFGCRHVARWYGGTGGITSLAAWGPKGNDNRIGQPCDALISNVANVFDATPEAVAAFAAVQASR